MSFEWLPTRRLFGLNLTGSREHRRRTREWIFRLNTDEDTQGNYTRIARTEIVVNPPHFEIGIGVQWGGEDSCLSVNVDLMGTHLWITTAYGKIRAENYGTTRYAVDIEWDQDSDELRSYLNWGAEDKNGNRDFKFILWSDMAFGERKYTEGVPEVFEVDIPLPEGSYRWRLAIQTDEWKRPRWPWPSRVQRVHADALEGEGIPIPGKGENGWDIEDDCMSGLTTTCEGLSDAIGKIVANVLRTRHQRGSIKWRPDPKPESTSEPAQT